MNDKGRVLIIVQNLPVPFDRRVWLECRTLTDAGYQVAVVCPKGPGDPGYAVVEGVELFKYRPFASGGGTASFFVEYLYSFAATFWLALKAARRGQFAAVQSCNPPDIFWPIAAFLRVRMGPASFSTTTTCVRRPTNPGSRTDQGCSGRACASWNGGRFAALTTSSPPTIPTVRSS